MLVKKICGLILFFLGFFCIGFSSAVFAQAADITEIADDFWLMNDFQPLENTLWLYTGKDEDEGDYYGLSTTLSLSSYLRVDVSATRQNYIFETEDLQWGFSGDISEQFSWGIHKLFWGDKDVLERNDIQYSLGYFIDGFSSQLSYESGDFKLYLKQPNELPINYVSFEHRATQLNLGYSWGLFFTQLSYKKHDYTFNRPGLLFYLGSLNLLNNIGLDQARNLADKESSLLLSLQFETISYGLQLSQIDSAFLSNRNQYLSLSLQKYFGLQWVLEGNVDFPVNEGLSSAGLSLGYLW